MPQARSRRAHHCSPILRTRLSRWQPAPTSKTPKSRRRSRWSKARLPTQSSMSLHWQRAKTSPTLLLARSRQSLQLLTNLIRTVRACSISSRLGRNRWISSTRSRGRSRLDKSRRARTSPARSLTARARSSRRCHGSRTPSQRSTAPSM